MTIAGKHIMRHRKGNMTGRSYYGGKSTTLEQF